MEFFAEKYLRIAHFQHVNAGMIFSNTIFAYGHKNTRPQSKPALHCTVVHAFGLAGGKAKMETNK